MSGSYGSEHPVEAISALVDGELRAAERAEVEAHIASCPACEALLDDLRRLARTIPDLTGPEVPAGLEERVKAGLRADAGAPGRRRFGLPVAVAATLGAVGLLMTVQFRQAKPEPEAGADPSPVAIEDESRRSSRDRRPAPLPVEEDPDLEPAAEPRGEHRSPAALPPAPAFGPEPAPPTALAPSSRREAAEPGAEGAERDADAVAFAAPPSTTPVPEPEMRRERQALVEKKVFAKSAAKSPFAGAPSPCIDAWRLPGVAAWDPAGEPDPVRRLADLAERENGSAARSQDERGAFVTLEVPAAAWPRISEELRLLGVDLPGAASRVPDPAPCVRLEVRLAPSDPS